MSDRQLCRYKIRATKSAKRAVAALSQLFRVLLFWQWIRPKVCVDQHPFVALFHKDTRRFCADRCRLSVLVLGKAGVVVSQDGNILRSGVLMFRNQPSNRSRLHPSVVSILASRAADEWLASWTIKMQLKLPGDSWISARK